MSEYSWKWFGNAGHLIVAQWCRFHLCTQVGAYLVSTVGQYWPERPVREIHAQVHDPIWFSEHHHRTGDDFDEAYMQRFGYEEIGYGRTFETLVFKAGTACTEEECACGLPDIDGSEIDGDSYHTAGEATAGHMAMCCKWDKAASERSLG